MTLARANAPMLPEFEAFLFASVGEEVNGLPLSVLSALTRLDLDPWDEAARLARLTREAAADQLARMIARLSDRRWSIPEARRISDGLIKRLPMAGAAAKDDRPAPGTRLQIGLNSPSLLVYLAMALAILVGLIAGGCLSFGG
jgi:hypothetical protein